MNEMTDTGAVALPATQTDMAALFSDSSQVDVLIERIEREVRSHAPDLTTAKGRRAVASLAAKVSKSKVALDNAGKELNESARAQINAVDAERRKIRDRLDALRDEARKPLTDWEEAEEARKAAIKRKVEAITIGAVTVMSPSQDIRVRLASIEAVEIDDSWAEFEDDAAFAKDTVTAQLKQMLEAALAREEQERVQAEQERELARLRKEAEERAARDEAERIERERKEAEARAEAERLEREERERREAAERAVREEEARKAAAEKAAREKAEAVERARKEAAERAEREAAEAEARHKAELEQAKREAEAAALRERERIAAEKAREEAAAARRAANRQRQKKVHGEIVHAIEALEDQSPSGIAKAILNGMIPHVTAVL